MKLSNIFTLSLGLVLAIGVSSCNKDNKRVEDFSYSFNTGQVAAAYAYDGDHPSTLGATMQLVGEKDGTMISVTLSNTVNGEMYNIHAHDAADAATTPNGTPYDETPNAALFTQMLTGTGGAVTVSQKTTMTVTEITETYEGFFVVHDPLQPITTVDPTTYVILGSFAR